MKFTVKLWKRKIILILLLMKSALHAKEMLEYRNGQVAIHPRHNKLITALRSAVENGEGSLDKEATSHDDSFDVCP
jgi:hypothetical protein